VWLKFVKNKLQIRSVGGLENSKNDLCDGYKWGELIAGVKNSEQIKKLESSQLGYLIKSVSVVSGNTLSIILNDNYIGREYEAINEIKLNVDLKYLELNLFMHPIGESFNLK
jgi:hypothetical protein